MSAIVPVNTTSTASQDGNKVLNQLLEAVQQCQKRYGGKTELATEFDNCVAALCLSLEGVFAFGLRNKPQEVQQSSALKQVSEIVSNSLHLNNDNPSFWPFVKKHLTKHERERYEVLKHIWTDTGRGRAWIRSSLNERSLERYFHIVLSNQQILNSHYEDWAILCDQEKSSMLPNMAAGLGSILFAINIDKPELNSGASYRSEKLKVQPEPIIEAPIPELGKENNKNRKKRRVAKQLISFDEDGDSVLSSSVPSSCSSIASESSFQDSSSSTRLLKQPKSNSQEGSSSMDSKSVGTKNKVSESTIDTKTDREKPKRRLSNERVSSNKKFSTNIDGPLTPVEQVNIGELTPVSVETSDNLESPNNSENMIEVPTDISAVLTVVETKNQEEVNKLQFKIENLSKENCSLKEQVKKYVGAIQMLKRDDANLQKALEGLQIDPQQQPDYQSEAKMFEKKLVQVAEMHAELMDFNVHLQQALCQKETLVERLKSELEELRGPVSNDELDEDSRGSVNIWIPSAFLTGTGSDAHHVYQIFLRAGNDEWNIYRRYAQFHALHTELKKLDPSVAAFDFPPKKSLGRKDSAIVEDRRKRLQKYLRTVLSHWPELSHCNSRFLLEQHLTFFKDQKPNDHRNKIENKRNVLPSRRGNSSNDNHYTGL